MRERSGSPLCIPRLLACALAVFFACIAIDKMRISLVSIPEGAFARHPNSKDDKTSCCPVPSVSAG